MHNGSRCILKDQSEGKILALYRPVLIKGLAFKLVTSDCTCILKGALAHMRCFQKPCFFRRSYPHFPQEDGVLSASSARRPITPCHSSSPRVSFYGNNVPSAPPSSRNKTANTQRRQDVVVRKESALRDNSAGAVVLHPHRCRTVSYKYI